MPQEKVIDGSIRMSDDCVDSSVLIVQTLYHLFVLDLNKGDKPTLLKTIDFVKNHLPLNMGVMRLGKLFFMFGGERGVKMYIPGTDRFIIEYDKSFGQSPFEGVVKDVYELNTKEWYLEKTTDVKNSIGPKFNPTVRYVNGKIFVFPGPSFLRRSTPQSIYEVYDPTAKSWELLPEIPIVDSQYHENIIKSGSIPRYFFVGCRMYLQFDDDNTLIFCFNCDSEEWEKKNAINLRDSLERSGKSFPDFGLCVSENIVLNRDNTTIWAYFIDDSGFLLYYQSLRVLCRGIIGECNKGFTLIDPKKSDGRLCLVSIEPTNNDACTGCVYTIHIRHFELKETNCTASDDTEGDGSFPKRKRFLQVGSFENQQYTLPDVGKYRFISLWDAFFL